LPSRTFSESGIHIYTLCFSSVATRLSFQSIFMFRNFRYRFITVLLALTSVLFTQLALAAYVCPGGGAKASESSMPCAQAMSRVMDEEQSSLCHAHCQADQQKADSYQMPVLASLPHRGSDYLTARILPSPTGAPLQAPLLRRTTAPPLAIRNCCFRL
jgi:hypothetical protein